MRQFVTVLLFCYFGLASQAADTVTVLNEVIFSEGDQSWTSRDLRLYEKLLEQVLKRKSLSAWSENKQEDFLLSRLVHREALLFGVMPEKDKLSVSDRKNLSEFSAREIDIELVRINYVMMFMNLKENQLKQKDRFASWLSHLKRKYQARLKVPEIAK